MPGGPSGRYHTAENVGNSINSSHDSYFDKQKDRRRARKYEAYDFENVLPTAKPPPGTQSFWEAYQEQGNLYFGDFLQGGHLQEYCKI